MTTQIDRYAGMSTETLLKLQRQWRDALKKRKAGEAQKTTWRRFVADADAVLKDRGVTP